MSIFWHFTRSITFPRLSPPKPDEVLTAKHFVGRRRHCAAVARISNKAFEGRDTRGENDCDKPHPHLLCHDDSVSRFFHHPTLLTSASRIAGVILANPVHCGCSVTRAELNLRRIKIPICISAPHLDLATGATSGQCAAVSRKAKCTAPPPQNG